MSLETRFQNSSLRLINRYGKVRDYHRVVSEAYNVDAQRTDAQTEVHPVKMYKTEAKDRETKTPNLVNRETAVMLIAAKSLAFKPKIGDKITESYLDDISTYRVESVKEAWAGDSTAMWRLICTNS